MINAALNKNQPEKLNRKKQQNIFIFIIILLITSVAYYGTMTLPNLTDDLQEDIIRQQAETNKLLLKLKDMLNHTTGIFQFGNIFFYLMWTSFRK